MEKFSKWDDEEVKTLFKFVEIKKSEGMPLVKIFDEYSKCTHRQKNSIRNYYYKELSFLLNNKNLVKELGIDLTCHYVNRGVPFSRVEEKEVVTKIDSLIKEGNSVRKACLILSNGDVPTMLRLQNKYRSLTKKKENVKNMGQIIKMPTKCERITEDDIKALFMGLVKLVKKQEQENIKSVYENELNKANEKLKLALAEIVEKQNKIERLKKEISIVKSELGKSKEQIIKQRIIKNKNLTVTDAMKEYFSNKTTSKRAILKNS